MRQGDWKIIEFFESQTLEIYDLSQDPGERNDFNASMPDKAKELAAALHAWQEETRAPRPTAPNPAFDPSIQPERGKGKGGGGGKRPKRAEVFDHPRSQAFIPASDTPPESAPCASGSAG
jgi:hypothetical protein